jgi:hypothetical protein
MIAISIENQKQKQKSKFLRSGKLIGDGQKALSSLVFNSTMIYGSVQLCGNSKRDILAVHQQIERDQSAIRAKYDYAGENLMADEVSCRNPISKISKNHKYPHKLRVKQPTESGIVGIMYSGTRGRKVT